MTNRPITTIAILGAGLIGGSWAALFLSYGYRVRLADPRPEAAQEVLATITQAWPHLGRVDAPPLDRLAVFTTISEACAGADFVQECGPDRIDPKRAMIAQAEAVLGHDVLIASSTSSLLASDIATGADHPERILVAHPMNPPHLVPLVELVAGQKTAPEAMTQARAFYDSIGRVTVVVQKERVGHLANRLTSALYREAVHIVAEGIASVEDVDRAIAWGPGMRWAFMGPHLIYHLGGGKGGYAHYLEHLGPTQEERWKDLGAPKLTAETIAALIAGLDAELNGMDREELSAQRDEALVALAALKRQYPFAKPAD